MAAMRDEMEDQILEHNNNDASELMDVCTVNEADIPPDYNQDPGKNGGQDEDDLPHRHIVKWFLTRSKSASDDDSKKKSLYTSCKRSKAHIFSMRRHPLPSSNRFCGEYTLHGQIPHSRLKVQSAQAAPSLISVSISDLKIWVIDRSDDNRGIWIESKFAWYWLLQPDDQRISLNTTLRSNVDSDEFENSTPPDVTASLPSQEEVHLPLRAQFGLVSNLVDLLSEPFQDEPYNYINIHAKRTPSNVHKLLLPSEEVFLSYQSNNHEKNAYSKNKEDLELQVAPLNREPFDLELLKSCPQFVKQHLWKLHLSLSESCIFIQELSEMVDPKGVEIIWEREDYLRSAEEAERRGFRHPCGQNILDSFGKKVQMVRPNRLIEIEIETALQQQQNVNVTSPVTDDVTDSSGKHCGPTNERAKSDEELDNHEYAKKEQRVRSSSGPTTDNGEDVFDPSDRQNSDRVYKQVEDAAETKRKNLVSDTALLILGDEKDSDLHISAAPSSKFSNSNMLNAIEKMAKFLTPEPSYEDKIDANYTKFSILEGMATPFLDEIVLSHQIPSLEYILLAVECIRSSPSKVQKVLFKTRPSKQVGGNIIFKKWISHSIEVIQSSRQRQQHIFDVSSSSSIIMDELKTEELICKGIISLINDFRVIKDMKQVVILKKKFSVDWLYIVEKTMAFAAAHKIKDILKACIKSKLRLDGMKNNNSTTESVAIKASGKIDQQTSKNNASLLDILLSSPSSSVKPSKLSKEELEKQNRAQRMAKMVATARTKSFTACHVNNGPGSASKPVIIEDDPPSNSTDYSLEKRTNQSIGQATNGGWGGSSQINKTVKDGANTKNSSWSTGGCTTSTTTNSNKDAGWGNASANDLSTYSDGKAAGWGSTAASSSSKSSGWGSNNTTNINSSHANTTIPSSGKYINRGNSNATSVSPTNTTASSPSKNSSWGSNNIGNGNASSINPNVSSSDKTSSWRSGSTSNVNMSSNNLAVSSSNNNSSWGNSNTTSSKSSSMDTAVLPSGKNSGWGSSNTARLNTDSVNKSNWGTSQLNGKGSPTESLRKSSNSNLSNTPSDVRKVGTSIHPTTMVANDKSSNEISNKNSSFKLVDRDVVSSPKMREISTHQPKSQDLNSNNKRNKNDWSKPALSSNEKSSLPTSKEIGHSGWESQKLNNTQDTGGWKDHTTNSGGGWGSIKKLTENSSTGSGWNQKKTVAAPEEIINSAISNTNDRRGNSVSHNSLPWSHPNDKVDSSVIMKSKETNESTGWRSNTSLPNNHVNDKVDSSSVSSLSKTKGTGAWPSSKSVPHEYPKKKVGKSEEAWSNMSKGAKGWSSDKKLPCPRSREILDSPDQMRSDITKMTGGRNQSSWGIGSSNDASKHVSSNKTINKESGNFGRDEADRSEHKWNGKQVKSNEMECRNAIINEQTHKPKNSNHHTSYDQSISEDGELYDQSQKQKRFRDDNHYDESKHRKRSRNASISLPEAEVRQTGLRTQSPSSTISHGVGRGRGRDATLPAWMTSDGASNKRPININKADTSFSKEISSNTLSHGGIGRGRGKEKTLPAWMTKEQGNTNRSFIDEASEKESRTLIDQSSSTCRSPPARGQSSLNNHMSGSFDEDRDRDNGGSFSRSNKSYHRTINNSGDANKAGPSFSKELSPRTLSHGGMGRGRGKDKTLPAWMTKDQNKVNFPAMIENRNSHKGETKTKFNEGREKNSQFDDINPSYNSLHSSMTNIPKRWDKSDENVQEKGNDMGRGLKDNHQNRFLTSPPTNTNGSGRGRGRERNRPAWMTSQK